MFFKNIILKTLHILEAKNYNCLGCFFLQLVRIIKDELSCQFDWINLVEVEEFEKVEEQKLCNSRNQFNGLSLSLSSSFNCEEFLSSKRTDVLCYINFLLSQSKNVCM